VVQIRENLDIELINISNCEAARLQIYTYVSSGQFELEWAREGIDFDNAVL